MFFPYIICEGVSEDYIYAKKYQIGVVLKSFNKIHVSESIQDIDNLLVKDKKQLRQQCRLIGLAYRGQSNIDKILNNIFQHTFFS